VILVDDELEVRLSGQQTLELAGIDVIALASAEEALGIVSRDWPGVVVSDVKMPSMDGLALLQRVRDTDADLPVVLITGHGDISMAIQAIRDGAYDFVEKPAPPEYLVDVVCRALDKRRLVLENRTLRRELNSLAGMERQIIGRTPAMEKLREVVSNLANADVDVLLVGETGTGKELVARCLHEFGGRRDCRFVALNCGAMPETIIESELFGHEAGAFTGAMSRRIGKIEFADGGTLFLDEIESMPLHLQVKLLRVLQERVLERLGGNDPIRVDIRVIAAAKVDLREACRAGRFRDDLYYRLNVASVTLPPLRDHPQDIPLLFQHFLVLACSRYGRPVPSPDPILIARLMAHSWPGNVRELRNSAERLVLGIPGDAPDPGFSGTAGDTVLTFAQQVDRFERDVIEQALARRKGRINQVAADLAVPRKTLYLKMRKFGLQRHNYR